MTDERAARRPRTRARRAVDPVPEQVRAAAIAAGRDALFERDPCAEARAVERAVERFAPAARGRWQPGAAGSRMVALAHARALDGPVTPNGRSFPREAREELADACNYLVWHRRLREGRGAGGAELAAVDRAIAALAVAWLELGWVS